MDSTGNAIVHRPTSTAATDSSTRKRKFSYVTAVNGTDFADGVSRKTKKRNKNIQYDLDVDDAIIASSQPTRSKCVSSHHRSHSADEDNIDRLCVFCGEASLLVDSVQWDNCSESYHLTCSQVPDANQARTMALVRFLG